MQRVAVNMQNALISQMVEQTLKTSGEFYTMAIAKPEDVAESCARFEPDILLMEVTGYTPWKLDDRMKIRDSVKKRSPACKVVLAVDECAERQIAERVKQAKRDGLIEQFVYESSSASFLVALMETL